MQLGRRRTSAVAARPVGDRAQEGGPAPRCTTAPLRPLTGLEEVESGSTVSVMEEVAARGVGESDPPIICADGPGLATTATMMFLRG